LHKIQHKFYPQTLILYRNLFPSIPLDIFQLYQSANKIIEDLIGLIGWHFSHKFSAYHYSWLWPVISNHL